MREKKTEKGRHIFCPGLHTTHKNKQQNEKPKWFTYGTKYSRMDQVKFVEDSL